jgi:hypothetical protein
LRRNRTGSLFPASAAAHSQRNELFPIQYGAGLNTQVGLRYRLTNHVSLFGEWKFNYAKINLVGQADVNHYEIDAVVTLHHFVFGLGYHF